MIEHFGDYELVTRINIGGMAEVFRARRRGDAGFVKESVLKRILPHYSSDEEFQRMFIDEARIAARLNHPNIVQVYHFGNFNGIYYIDMELVEGFDMRRVQREANEQQKPLGQNRATQIALAVAKGLGYAHNREEGLVHRDISPHNVLLSFSGDVKIMDFGIAKAAARATKTSTGVVKGKLAYMSPEQAQGLPIDARTDIYAAGICLWEMLTRQRLYQADGEMELLEKVRRGDNAPVRSVAPDVHETLARVVDKMLDADREQRYQKMRDVERDLSQALHDLGGEAIAPLDDYMKEVIPADARRAFSDDPSGTQSAPKSQVNTDPLTDLRSARTEIMDAEKTMQGEVDRTRSDSRRLKAQTLSEGVQGTRSASYHPPLQSRPTWVYLVAGIGALALAGVVAAVTLPHDKPVVIQPALNEPAPNPPATVTQPVMLPSPVAPTVIPTTVVPTTVVPATGTVPPPGAAATLSPPAGSPTPWRKQPKPPSAEPMVVKTHGLKLSEANATSMMISCRPETKVTVDDTVVKTVTKLNRSQPIFVPPGHHVVVAHPLAGQPITKQGDFKAGGIDELDCP